jgi:DHA1 family inner membrane transport protein
MAYLRNDAINRVNLHSGIHALALGAGGIFFLVFLISAGISVPVALLTMAGILAGRLVLRPAVLPLAKRWGVKPLVIVGTLGMALQYPLLAGVQDVGFRLVVLGLTVAVAEIFYWPAYHAYFAALGDAEHRGHQVSAREAAIAVASIVGPLIGTWALVTLGPGPMFAGVGLVQALAAVPLIGAPNVAVKQSASGGFRAARIGALLYGFDAWFAAWFLLVWPAALFLVLDESLAAYGGAMALAALVGAAAGLLLGRAIDAGKGRRAVVIACSFAAIAVLARAASLGSPPMAVIANALGAAVLPLLLPALGTAIYNLTKVSPCPLRFQIVAEAGWDIGAICGLVCAAGLYESGVPFSYAIPLAVPGIAVTAFVLWRYYPGAPGATPDEAVTAA